MMSRAAAFALISALCIGACASKAPPLPTPAQANMEAMKHNEAGITYYTMGEWETAKTHFEEAVAAQPDLAEAHFNLALTLHELGKHEEAKKEFIKAADLDPKNAAITQSLVYQNHVNPPELDKGRFGYWYN